MGGFFSDMSEGSFDTLSEENGEVVLEEKETEEDYAPEPGDEEYAPEPEEELTSDEDFGNLQEADGCIEREEDKSETTRLQGQAAPLEEKYAGNESSGPATVIKKETSISGRILSKGCVVVSGTVEESVEANVILVEETGVIQGGVSAGKVEIHGGTISGKIEGDDIKIWSGRVTSSLFATSVFVDDEAVVVGDISGEEVTVGGKVKGNICSPGVVTLLPTAVVKGDIEASDVVMRDGAKFQGSIKKTREIDDSEFEA